MDVQNWIMAKFRRLIGGVAFCGVLSIAFPAGLALAQPGVMVRPPVPVVRELPTVTVSADEFKRGEMKMKKFTPVVRRGNVYCHQLDQVTWYVVTGQNSEYGGIYCHR